MALVIIRQDEKIEAWKQALLAKRPDLEIYSYLEPHPKAKIRMALVWKHPAGSLMQYPNLESIASFGAGVDFIFEDKEVPQHLPITRVVDPVLASDMSEFVIGQILSYLKHLHLYKADQINHLWRPMEYKRWADISVGIMGMGVLGTVLASDLKKLGCKVHGWASSSKNIEGIPVYCGAKEKDTFLSRSSVLVCLLPLTEETRGILNKDLFTQLPKGAYIINVARGGHLVDDHLIEMIDKGQLSGAALDVFHQEPLGKGHPFWSHPSIHITPHVASFSNTEAVVPQLLENYQRLLDDRPLLNLVTRKKGY